jgi:hypothetical protein
MNSQITKNQQKTYKVIYIIDKKFLKIQDADDDYKL